MTTNEEQIAAEADARLDEFFSEDEWEAETEEVEKDSAQDFGIKELKALILSLDWEITDEIMAKLKNEVEKLKSEWTDDPVLMTFLSVLDRLGGYIGRKKADAHPDSVGLLQSAYQNLEKVLGSSGMDMESKKAIVKEDVARFKQLQREIEASKAGKAAPAPAPEPAEAQQESGKASAPSVQTAAVGAPPMDAQALTDAIGLIVAAINELKDAIKSESSALRAELEAMKAE